MIPLKVFTGYAQSRVSFWAKIDDISLMVVKRFSGNKLRYHELKALEFAKDA